MVYGPFSLADATDAEVIAKVWINTQPYNPGPPVTGDYLCGFASTDGSFFGGDCYSGDSSGWADLSVDLSNVTDIGNLLGDPSVWIAFRFYSDSMITFTEGAYVDDITLRKCTTGNCTRATEGLIAGEGSTLISFPKAEKLGPR